MSKHVSFNDFFFYLGQNETQVLIKWSDTSLLYVYSHKCMSLLHNIEIWISVGKARVFYITKEISVYRNWSKGTELY